jgi:hypothetical protein
MSGSEPGPGSGSGMGPGVGRGDGVRSEIMSVIFDSFRARAVEAVQAIFCLGEFSGAESLRSA